MFPPKSKQKKVKPKMKGAPAGNPFAYLQKKMATQGLPPGK